MVLEKEVAEAEVWNILQWGSGLRFLSAPWGGVQRVSLGERMMQRGIKQRWSFGRQRQLLTHHSECYSGSLLVYTEGFRTPPCPHGCVETVLLKTPSTVSQPFSHCLGTS